MESLALSSSRLGRTLRKLRAKAGLSIGALARATGLSKTSISNIEIGAANPSLETMWRLADALGVALGTLLGEETVPVLHLTRRDEGAAFAAASGLRGRILSTARQEHRTEVMELVFDAAIRHESAGHAPGTEELLICTEGEIEAGPEGEEAQLDVGDAMWFPGDRRHYYRTQDTARAILLMVYPAVTRSILTSPPQTEIAPGLRRRRHA